MRPLSDLDVIVVDCQTTGASPAFGSVLELAWCVVRPSEPELIQLQSHFITLPEGERVSPLIRKLTGLDQRQGEATLAPEAAWQTLMESVEPRPMPAAIHFARFELAFLRDWSQRFARELEFPFDAICVHALARRLYPELPKQTLRALAGFLGHSLDLTRHSLGHVQATAFIWRKLSHEIETRGVRSWEELAEWLATPAPPSARGRTSFPFPSARRRALPDAPGVYRFVRSNDDVLYVGKAASVKRRVASHFTRGSGAQQALEMLTQVSDVHVTLTSSALEAALLENETIKQLAPPYNIHLLTRDRRSWFATPDFSRTAAADSEHRIGPLPNAFALAPLGALIALESGEAPTREVRARAVAAAERWAPDDDTFAPGYATLRSKYFAALPAEHSARRRVLAAAREMLRASKVAVSEEDDAELVEPATQTFSWDPERVTRHLERAAAQAFQLLRRARWLCLLHDCTLSFAEPGSNVRRFLRIVDGVIVEARDLDGDEQPPPERAALPLRDRHAAFDANKYDRLRVLSTELKRLQREPNNVVVRVARSHTLSGARLDNILRWV